ncbi:MAG: hypothetical protein JOZ88_16825 [Hyphomicrobiales bacterium]|nr:hypothetical protein [Hyphomicrobiales bacterium]
MATAPMTVVPVITIEVVAWPAGFVTLVWGMMIICPIVPASRRGGAP